LKKGKKRIKRERTGRLILLLLGITGPPGQQQLEISSSATTCAVLRAKERANKPEQTAGATSLLPGPSLLSPEQDAQEH